MRCEKAVMVRAKMVSGTFPVQRECIDSEKSAEIIDYRCCGEMPYKINWLIIVKNLVVE